MAKEASLARRLRYGRFLGIAYLGLRRRQEDHLSRLLSRRSDALCDGPRDIPHFGRKLPGDPGDAVRNLIYALERIYPQRYNYCRNDAKQSHNNSLAMLQSLNASFYTSETFAYI
jgi:hypothetical protein